MTSRRATFVKTVLAGLVTPLLMVPSAGPAAAAGEPVLVTVRAEGGRLAPQDVELMVLADRSRNAVVAKGLVSRVEPRAVKRQVGDAVEVRLPTTAVRGAYVDKRTGRVDFEVWVRSKGRAKFGFASFSASPRKVGGALRWSDPDDVRARPLAVRVRTFMNGTFCASDADCAPLRQGLQASVASRKASKSVELDLRSVGRAPKAPSPSVAGMKGKNAKARVAAAAKSGRHPNCKNMGTHYNVDKTIVRGATVGTSYPTKRYPSYMTREARKGKSDSYSVKLESVVTGGHLGGTVERNGTKTLQRSTGFRWDPSDKNRAYRVRVVYDRFALWDGCVKMTDFPRIWRPTEYAGTTSEARIKSGKPVFKFCDRQRSPGVFHRSSSTGTAYGHSKGMKVAKVIGVDLSVVRQYSTEAVLVYDFRKVKPKKKKTQPWLCGNDTFAGEAGKIAVYKKKPR